MNILIFQSGEPLHIDKGNPRPMRAMNLANEFAEKGHSVTLVSSRFYHQEKRHRDNPVFTKVNKRIFTYLISSPGYKKNVSFLRFYDHIVLAINLWRFLKSNINNKPDLIISGYPPIETAYVLSKWAKKNDIFYILDTKDQWPTIIVESIPKPLIVFARLALAPMYFMAKHAMRNADINVSISDGFLSWVKDFAGLSNANSMKVLPLSAPKIDFNKSHYGQSDQWWCDNGVQKNKNLKIAFIGSFSRAFNFDPIFEAAKYCEEKNLPVEFIICGKGEQAKQMQHYAKNVSNVKLFDWIDIPKIKTLESIVDLSIAPYIPSNDFKMSIPNKVIDSFMAGLPVITSLEGDLKDMLEQNQAGFYYNDAKSLKILLENLSNNREDLEEISTNAYSLYEQKFHFNSLYNKFITEVENILLKVDKNKKLIK